MHNTTIEKPTISSETAGPCVGRIVGINSDGQAVVEFDGNLNGPCIARTIVSIPIEDRGVDLPVLLSFEGNDLALPIIVGILQDSIQEAKKEPEKEVFVDGEKLVFEAKKEIQLKCGKSSITLKKDGKILIRGTNLVSRASEANKIRGASVAIN